MTPETSLNPAFDPDELGWQLAATPNRRLHQTYGEGYRYALGHDAEEPTADLEVFPDANLIRYTAEGLAIALTSSNISGEYTEEEVIFDETTATKYRTLRINRYGEALLLDTLLHPLEPLESPEPNDLAPWDVAELPQPSTEPVQPNDPVLKTDTEKQQRVVLTGRAGKEPTLKQTGTGKDICKFPLATHEKNDAGEETTNWYTVVCFNGLAKATTELVKKGETYKVVGYEHEREDKGKTVKEVYAATVRPPTKKQQPPTK